MKKTLLLFFSTIYLIGFSQIPNPDFHYAFDNGDLTGLTQNGAALTQTEDRIHSATDAISLNGDYLTRGAYNVSNLTVSFWINTTVNDGNLRYVVNQTAGSKGWVGYVQNGKACFAASYEHGQMINGNMVQNYTGFAYLVGASNISDGRWHNVVATAAKSIYFDGAGYVKQYTYTLYVDGVQESTETVLRGSSGSFTNINADLCSNIPVSISTSVAANQYFDGVDDIRLYGGVVDAAGINALANEKNCVTAQNIQFTPTFNSVDLTWDLNADALSYDLVIVPAGDDISTGTPITGITTNSHTFTGLTHTTSYDVYIQAHCTGFSGWYGVAQNFSTLCQSSGVTAIAQNYSVILDGNGDAIVTAANINNGSVTSCGDPANISIDMNFFDCSHIGANTVTLTATDNEGNSDVTTAIVEVFPPISAQDITVHLDENGSVTVDPASVDNGTNTLCNSSLNFSLDIATFDCTNIGVNPVILTIDDGNGVSRTIAANVTVVDTVKPLVVTQNVTVTLDAFFNGSITPAMINNGSSDNCSGALTYSLSQTAFGCEDQGVHEVTLTVTDVNGNSASGIAFVTVNNVVADQVATAAETNFCNSGSASTTISTFSSDNGVKYYLRDANNNIIDGPINGNGNSLTFNTGTITASETYHVYGEKRAAVLNSFALDFDGSNDVVHTNFQMPATAVFTIEAWVQPRSTNYDRIISNYTGSFAGQVVIDTYNATDNGRGLRFYVVGTGNVTHSISAANALTLNSWNHIACTFDNGLMKIFVNGIELQSSQAPFSFFPAHPNTFSLGEDPIQGTAEYLNGQLDDIRFWNYARSASQIDSEQSKCLSGTENGLLAFYNLEDGTGIVATDLVAGRNGNFAGGMDNTDWIPGAYVCQNYCGTEMSEQVTIFLGDTYSVTETAAICAGSDYTFPDGTTQTNITAEVIYSSTLQTYNGCDSIVETTLTVNPSYNLTETVAICSGTDYTFPDGTTQTNITAGLVYSSTLQSNTSCDSIIETTLTISPNYNLNETFTICSGSDYTFPDGSTQSGISSTLTYVSNLMSSTNCDSIISTTLTINPSYNLTETASICAGGDYTFPDGTTQTNITSELIYTSAFQTTLGCDSLITTTINVNPSYNLTEDVFICLGEDYTFHDGTIEFNITSTFTHSSTIPSSNFCDSIIVTTVNPLQMDASISNTDNVLTANQINASYQWVDCDNGNAAILGETGQTFMPTANGNYACIVNFQNCAIQSDCELVSTLGLNNAAQMFISVYPNPATSVVYVETDATIEEIKVFSVSGELIQTEKQNSFSVVNLAKGTYLLEIKTNMGTSQKVFMKQ